MGRTLFSICAVVLAVALGGSSARDSHPSETGLAGTTKSASTPIASTPLAVVVVESDAQAERDRQSEAKSDEHERLNLRAQQKAANAAYFAAWFSGISTLLVIGALVQTSLANMRQMRAYVGIDKVRVTEMDDGGQEFSVVVKNFGQTPAYRFDGHCELRVGEHVIRTDYPPDEIMPVHNVNMTFTVAAAAMAKVRAGEMKLSIVGGGTYKDLARQRRRMCFSMEYHVATESLIAYGGENRAD
ncbi:hypothetical protein GGQ87_000482 [Brevundimonas alba]|uniref:Uncharacterized protein n=1 Tax=Brevundimonas alba TaxID=74314 RepID=A0A7X5YK94_9CAUL|nr:hypothetical protein [Brevundimonas alba]NJC40224.1 hypothetical protein [Brevundimonas alba]